MNILIIKTSSMGDAIHCLPIIADIRAKFPDAKIDWVIEESFAEILALNPHINAIIPVAIRRWRKHLFSKSTWREISCFKKQLSAEQYDLILDMQSLLKSALITTFAKGIRHGQNYKTTREPLAALFYHHTHFVPRNQHAVEQNRALAAKTLGYTLPASLPEYGLSARPSDDESGIDLPENYVIAFHATSRDSKLWPVDHWIALGKALQAKGFTLVIPWGNEDEHLRANTIAENVASSIVLPKFGLATLAGVIGKATAAIGVDTGLIHLAIALKIPSIAIYTDTYPALNGAYAGEGSIAINLGGKNDSPDVNQVLTAFSELKR
ncbi:lipopolysaccharide heptosyltransferase I [Methyloradius palustris]|uniref:Lipopolysaccharide heptosyltransferase 1 n=1 Tax=Methyloradius palustris TaxID=2778876 RepID=A0A8D5JQK2_9PROT|nr:lipopolysaccharide heptosyltransferase I [Methyloradius palustris]BCM24566.1 ADP-heptose--LPS heptosyltransferase [Methyloradius palustris]